MSFPRQGVSVDIMVANTKTLTDTTLADKTLTDIVGVRIPGLTRLSYRGHLLCRIRSQSIFEGIYFS